MRLADDFGLKVERIYANPSVLSRFLKDKVKDANVETSTEKKISHEEDETPKGEKKSYVAHAESQTSLNKSDRRLQEAQEKGWFAVFAVTFADKPDDNVTNKIESVPIEHVVGKTLTLKYPYVVVMLKEEERRS